MYKKNKTKKKIKSKKTQNKSINGGNKNTIDIGIDILIKTNMKSDTKDKILNKINSNRSKKFLYKCAGGKDGVFMINDRIIYDKTMPKGKTKYYTNTLKLFNNIENIDFEHLR